MFTAAAVLANIEARFPDAVRYSVRFAKPVLLPATAGLYVAEGDGGWDLTLRNMAKGYPPPDRYRAGSIAGATRIGPAWSAIRRYRVPHA